MNSTLKFELNCNKTTKHKHKTRVQVKDVSKFLIVKFQGSKIVGRGGRQSFFFVVLGVGGGKIGHIVSVSFSMGDRSCDLPSDAI